MKLFLRLSGLFLLLSLQLVVLAQNDAQKRILVYFITGAQRNPPPNQNTVTITSASITQTLGNYGLSVNNVSSAFPDFNEIDTIPDEIIGEDSRQMNYAKVFAISLPDTSFKSSLINSLLNLSETLYAESDGDATTNIIPADPGFGQQWNMRNTIVPGADIHAERAWDIFTGNPNAVIAIIDAGVDINHNDLAAKINGGDIGFTLGFDPFLGQFSHGSHVAGIAAAVTNNNNNNGVAGVDWQATIHPRHVIGNNSGDAGITRGINEALRFGPNVWTFNHSWSLIQGIDGFGNAIPGRYSVTIRSAFANVYRNNRVSCVAMGNHQAYSGGVYANQVSFPSGFNSGLINVGATDINDGIGNFSANGPHIDVSAPGVNILSTNFNNGYVVLSGTSMATPHVSGLASLLRGFNPNLANDDIEQITRLTADDANALTNPGFDNQMGMGRINAERALQSLQAPNQLFHWTVTGGTIVNTSGIQPRVFLGVPGLRDGIYIVRRSEVRVNIVFPNAMCSMIGAWGRGVGTTGFREEFGRCFGEGTCEIVPGTLTNGGATLRTWIYEVWGLNGGYYGFQPRTPNNVVFQYTVLGVPAPAVLPTRINGDNNFCTTSNNYTIPNLPGGAVVHWEASPQGIVTINSPNAQQTTLTRIADGEVLLTATVNFCITLNLPFITIKVGSPPVESLTVNGVNPATTLVCHSSEIMLVANPSIADQNAWYEWNLPDSWVSLETGTNTVTTQDYMTSVYPGSDGTIYVRRHNECGYSGFYSVFVQFDYWCGNYYIISPNPATDNITIDGQKQKKNIKEIQIVDKTGRVRKLAKYGNNVQRVTLNISDLAPDVYYIKIFDGKEWRNKSIIVN